MEPTPNERETQKALFINLVIMLASSGMQYLGKLMDPATQKTSVNLDAAQAMIDLLEMLKARTLGNLDAEETRFLADSVASLQLNFVETMKRQPAPEGAAKPSETATGAETAPAEGPAKPADQSDDAKFHKSYG